MKSFFWQFYLLTLDLRRKFLSNGRNPSSRTCPNASMLFLARVVFPGDLWVQGDGLGRSAARVMPGLAGGLQTGTGRTGLTCVESSGPFVAEVTLAAPHQTRRAGRNPGLLFLLKKPARQSLAPSPPQGPPVCRNPRRGFALMKAAKNHHSSFWQNRRCKFQRTRSRPAMVGRGSDEALLTLQSKKPRHLPDDLAPPAR